ncbi:MAG TPA: crosslink repair DNA glycosylase YcaQ family protein [Gaiellaceae bacterium]|nr:crosslink repair DNA glycosylase YcaQ family protein [Gaiellaceae bacterium]
MPAPLKVTRAQVLAFRRRTGALDERLPAGAASLQRAARAGLTDSMPRAALLGLHARVEGVGPTAWDDPALVQVWGPRYSVYVVPVDDLAIFTFGRLPDTGKTRARAQDLAARLQVVLAGEVTRDTDVAAVLGVKGWELKYAALTGTIAIRWEGARAPILWTVPPPTVEAAEATRELARRFLHVFGPSEPAAFAGWAGIGEDKAARVFAELEPELVPVRAPLGEARVLALDEATIREPAAPTTGVRLLPSGDAYTLGVTRAERAFLLPDEDQRGALWTPRVWPGAVLVDGKIAGTWRRAKRVITIDAWRKLSGAAREAVVAEAEALPLPDPGEGMTVHWS